MELLERILYAATGVATWECGKYLYRGIVSALEDYRHTCDYDGDYPVPNPPKRNTGMDKEFEAPYCKPEEKDKGPGMWDFTDRNKFYSTVGQAMKDAGIEASDAYIYRGAGGQFDNLVHAESLKKKEYKLRLEVGKTYERGDGKLVKITGLTGDEKYPFVGDAMSRFKPLHNHTYTFDGVFNLALKEDNRLSLIREMK